MAMRGDMKARQWAPTAPGSHDAAGRRTVDTVDTERRRSISGQIASRLADRLTFMSGLIAHPVQVGSIIASSRFAEGRIVRAADVGQARTVVELGPGTGGTTRALLCAMQSDARLLAIELSPMFHARLRANLVDSRLILQQGSAEHLIEFLQRWRLPAPDVVVSGIPFSTMPAATAARVAATIAACLAPGGRFVAYQIFAGVSGVVTPHLGPPVIAWEWLNVPPVRIYRWVKPHEVGATARDGPVDRAQYVPKTLR